MSSKLRVLYRGPIGFSTGYAQAAQTYMLALLEAGVELKIQPIIDAVTEDIPQRFAKLVDCVDSAQDPEWPTHCIVHTIPNYANEFIGKGEMLGAKSALPKSVKTLCITTWESSFLENRVIRQLEEAFDLTVVPSLYCEEAFVNSGMSPDKLRVIPHCFDPGWWFVGRPPRAASQPYTFYTIGVWSARKNMMGLLTAYFSAFDAEDPVSLTIVTPNIYEGEIHQLIKAGGLETTPRVEILGLNPNRLTDEQIRDVHLHSDCFVTAARAEGWGLGAFEAMLVGNPVIATDYSGFKDFLPDYKGFYPVDYVLTPVLIPELLTDAGLPLGDGKMMRFVKHTDTSLLCCKQDWAEPGLSTMREQMRTCFSQASTPTRFRMQQTMMRDRFSYAAVGKRLVTLLEHM